MELQVKMPENSRYNFFTNKETTNKVPSNIICRFRSTNNGVVRVLKAQPQKQRLMEHFQSLKTSNAVYLVYLEGKLQQDRWASGSHNLKCLKTAGVMYFEASKQQTRHRATYFEVSKMKKAYA